MATKKREKSEVADPKWLLDELVKSSVEKSMKDFVVSMVQAALIDMKSEFRKEIESLQRALLVAKQMSNVLELSNKKTVELFNKIGEAQNSNRDYIERFCKEWRENWDRSVQEAVGLQVEKYQLAKTVREGVAAALDKCLLEVLKR